MPISHTKRPRNVNAFQAAAILYGDWGTSKAYVIGLAFAIAGYSSFWLIAAVCVLMFLVGVNYISICKFNPTGGGVYTSARRKSEVLALIGAFFLIADYLVTAALSSLSCYEYLGVSHPAYWAIGSIFVIGLINFFGPRHSGNLALVLALATVSVVVLLGIISLPFIGDAARGIEAPKGGLWTNWSNFVGIIVALSGIEAIANTTGVMKLDPGSTEDNPSVSNSSTKAIIWVMTEVCIFTALFGFMMNAIPGLEVVNGDVNAPNESHIRDSMLRYMGDFFVSHHWGGEVVGHAFGYIVSLVFALLLLSATNTAITALISLLFVMSRDGEMPGAFQTLTPFGVPRYPLLLATIAPAIILLFVHDVASLADLYAVGFVGAIATNLGVNAYDQTLPMSRFERYFMWGTCAIMAVIELTLFVDKPNARRFAISMLTAGLILRALVIEHRQRQWATKKVKLKHASLYTDDTRVPLHQGAMLCAVRSVGKTLNFALQEAKKYEQPLYILFIREQKIITEEDRSRTWLDDEEACRIFDYAKDSSHEMVIKFFYTVSDSPVDTIVDMAERLHVSRIILGRPRHSAMLQMLRGNVVREVSEILPPEIDLLVIS
ncbi:universal stress protein [Candidatus Protochlamydia phocaeensis]|uniref:universal stress protein n=1 Tax=Candidatus Protochlamydia phocaeensis TaxID=1414722 RepID=UPI00083973D7|nr:amino acid permease [Candidatus Protochlamydia phocaeensis]